MDAIKILKFGSFVVVLDQLKFSFKKGKGDG